MSATRTSALLVVNLPGAVPPPGSPASPPAAAPASHPLALVDEIEQRLGDGPALVLVHDDRPAGSPAGQPGHELALVQAALRRDDVVLHRVTGPVTRTLLAARLLAGSQAPAGCVAALAGPVLAAVRTYALLGSVTHLENPAPSLAQHARGWAPGGCFLVDRDSVQAVKGRLPRGIGRGAEGELAVGEGLGADSDWPERLWTAVGPPAAAPHPSPVPGRAMWGTSRWAEISVSDTPAAQVAADLAAAPRRSCPWCSREVLAAHPCPYCGAGPRRLDAHRPEDPS